jgi:hypothetical protein
MSDADIPIPWQIADGPHRLAQSLFHGTAWLFTLERDGHERQLIVAVTGQALELEAPDTLPTQTRDAIATNGRSEAARVAQFDDPTSCVLLGQHGYLPPPLGLARLIG